MYRVVLADDEDRFREWLRSLLGGRKEFQVVGEARTGKDACNLAASLMPDLVIADIYMPDGDGLDVARSLRRHQPEIKTILISAHTDRAYERLAEEADALAFIPKSKVSLDALMEHLEPER